MAATPRAVTKLKLRIPPTIACLVGVDAFQLHQRVIFSPWASQSDLPLLVAKKMAGRPVWGGRPAVETCEDRAILRPPRGSYML
ncbi:hypothetical protein C1O66_11670 [Paucibacter aquatile]|uniref:Uncharacterized protein n=1 Tax=Kinneretia aquatilis TaxID=2070761 RepID=A0A2N8KXG9_9BURK|nr:hypothetical protein C1O66_11670 [Paucibacter aquatile]